MKPTLTTGYWGVSVVAFLSGLAVGIVGTMHCLTPYKTDFGFILMMIAIWLLFTIVVSHYCRAK